MTLKTFELTPAQKGAIAYSKNRDSLPILMKMGRGKSLTALKILEDKKKKRILLICPKSLFKHWAKHIRDHTDYTYTIASGNKAKRINMILADVNIVIINFEGARICGPELKKIAAGNYFDALVIDELARVRRYSKQMKAIYNIAQSIPTRIGLSGLLIAESLMDAFNPLKIISLGRVLGNDYFKFRDLYFTKEDAPHAYGKWIPTKFGLKIIPALIKNNAYIVDDDEGLPVSTFTNRFIALSKEQEAFLATLKSDWTAKFPSLKEEDRLKYTIQLIQKANQCVNGFVYRDDDKVFWFDYNPKAQELASLVEDLYKEKFVVMCNYKAEKALIKQLLEKMGKKICTEHDSTNFDTGDYDCYVGSFSKDSSGHNFGSAKVMIFYSRPNSYEYFAQSQARIRRTDSKHKSVSYQIISSRHWVELKNDEALRQKKDLSEILKGTNLEKLWNTPT